jgi:hypothetical protein
MIVDISREDFVLLNGVMVPVSFISALVTLTVSGSCECRIETDTPTVQSISVTREGNGAVTFTSDLKVIGTPGKPVESINFAELVSPAGVSKTVRRDRAEYDKLIGEGWTEGGRTKPKAVREIRSAGR